MNTVRLGMHEKLEAHELLTLKNLAFTKAVTMSGLAQDEELKTILSEDVVKGEKHIRQLKAILLDGSDANE